MFEWLKRWRQKRPERRFETPAWLDALMSAFGGGRSSSGITVNEMKASTVPAVYTAVRFISSTIAALPLHVYRRTESGGREVDYGHWSYPLLHDSPNEDHTSYTWRELTMAHVLLWGNAYSRIDWLANGAAGALYPLMPWNVVPMFTKSGAKFYRVWMPDGKEDLDQSEVIHVPGLSYDGLKGFSVVAKMRDAIGLAKVTQDMAGAFFKNGPKLGAILEVPARMKPEAQKNLVTSLSEKYAQELPFAALVLEEGAKLHGPTSMPLKDAQFVEFCKLTRSEIFGWYGLPPHLGGDTERSTSWGTGIEQQDIGYAKHTITPWCVRIEQELNRKLYGRRAERYVKHSLEGLMRGDFKSRMEGMQIAVGRPWLSPNEARELEDWNRSAKPGMDDVWSPLNMAPGVPTPQPEGAGAARAVIHVLPSDPAAEERMASIAAEIRAFAERELPAPVVHVRNDVQVQPAEVKVQLPDRKRDSTVEYDEDGEIKKIHSVERDA